MSEAGELAVELSKHVGRRVRISSDVVKWEGPFTTLVSVSIVNGQVWCQADNGMAWMVESKGLSVELEPIIGTRDFSDGVERVEAIVSGLHRYGTRPSESARQCHCSSCEPAHIKASAEHEASFGEPPMTDDTAAPEPTIPLADDDDDVSNAFNSW